MPGPMPDTADDLGNLDPRACDCGKGSACPLMTPEWERFLGPATLKQMDEAAQAVREPLARFVVVDQRDGMVIDRDALNRPFATKEAAERLARHRNDGLFAAFQTYRVYALTPVLFADVKPRTGAKAE